MSRGLGPLHESLLAGCKFLFLLTALVSTGLSQTQSAPPLVTVVSPLFNSLFPLGPVQATVHLRSDAQGSTFEARLNGTDIHLWFTPQSGCASGYACDLTALLPQDLLVQGTNVLTADAEGDGQSSGAARVQFEYADDAASLRDPVKHLVPGVAINSNYLTPGGNYFDISKYHILIGPGPGFAQRDYRATSLSCPGIPQYYSMQVLVLNRATLDPDPTIAAGTDHVGQACFGDGASLKTFLAGIAQGRLVIANSFAGRIQNLDTTAIGGTNYTVAGTPVYTTYSIIGVKGAAAGTASESLKSGLSSSSATSLAPLLGSLMLDNQQQYSFVSSEYREIEVIPNDPATPGNTASTINYAGTPCRGSLPGGASGGFLVCNYDRRDDRLLKTGVFSTNQVTQSASAAQVASMADYLNFNDPEDQLIMVASIGTPFSTSQTGVISQDLVNILNALGGTAGILPQLSNLQSNGKPNTYALITSGDPQYVANPEQVVVQSSVWSTQGQTGAVQALLSRNQRNWMVVNSAIGETYDGATLQPIGNFQWQVVGYQQPQDWPAWTATQTSAYLDLTGSSNRYPSIKRNLGCSATTCPDIRSYYSGVVGGGGSAALNVVYSGLIYVPNEDYSADDFTTVITQLETEQGYLGGAQAIYNQFAAMTGTVQGSLQAQLAKVATNLEATLVESNESAATTASYLTTAATGAKLLSGIPGVGPAFGAAAGLMQGLSKYAFGPQDLPSSYQIALQDLRNGTSRVGVDLAESNNTLFTGIVSDWGKLQTIGGGYGAQQSPWYMCATCQDSNIPTSAIPALALGAKRNFYTQLLPNLYTLDQRIGLSETQPGQVGATEKWNNGGVPLSVCNNPYANAPAGSWTIYPNPSTPSKNDFSFLVYTQYTKSFPLYFTQIHLPTPSLVADLFGNPSLAADGTLAGGAGLILDRFTTASNRPVPIRAGYVGYGACAANVNAADFAMGTSTSVVTVTAGESAQLNVGFLGIDGFSGPVSLSCSNLPAGDTCTFNPTTLEVDSNGEYETITISTVLQAKSGLSSIPSTVHRARWVSFREIAFAFLFPCSFFAGCVRQRRKPLIGILSLTILLGASISVTGCTTQNIYPPAPNPVPVITQVTISATSGSVTHTAVVTLQVQ